MCLVVSVSASHTVGRWFTSRAGHTKDHHKNGTNCLPAWHACFRLQTTINFTIWSHVAQNRPQDLKEKL